MTSGSEIIKSYIPSFAGQAARVGLGFNNSDLDTAMHKTLAKNSVQVYKLESG